MTYYYENKIVVFSCCYEKFGILEANRPKTKFMDTVYNVLNEREFEYFILWDDKKYGWYDCNKFEVLTDDTIIYKDFMEKVRDRYGENSIT